MDGIQMMDLLQKRRIYHLTNQQYIFIYQKAKKYLDGIPDPIGYRNEVGKTWEKIKSKSHNEKESQEAFNLICTFARIIESASEGGIEL